MSMVHEHITWEHSERTRPSKRTLIEKYRWVMRPLCRDSGYPAVWNFGLERYKIVMEGPDGVRLRKLNHIRTIRGTTAIEGNTLTEEQITAVLAGKRVVATRRTD